MGEEVGLEKKGEGRRDLKTPLVLGQHLGWPLSHTSHLFLFVFVGECFSEKIVLNPHLSDRNYCFIPKPSHGEGHGTGT